MIVNGMKFKVITFVLLFKNIFFETKLQVKNKMVICHSSIANRMTNDHFVLHIASQAFKTNTF
jgi:hypothetical protein